MENTIFDQTILAAHAQTIIKRFSIRKMMTNTAGMLVGAAAIMTAIESAGEPTSALYLFLMTLGVVLVSIFAIRLVCKADEMVYEPTKSAIGKVSLFLRSEEMQNILKAVESGRPEGLQKFLSERNSGVRLDLLYSRDEKFAACQLFAYVPYNYEPASKVYTIDDQRSGEFCKTLQLLAAKQ